MAIAFPSYSCSSSTSADCSRLSIGSPPQYLPVTYPHLPSRFTGLKIRCPSKVLQLPRIFPRQFRVLSTGSDIPREVCKVTDETWKSLVLDADCPVLVVFWAPWCGPCRMFHPVAGELAREYVGRLKCLYLNTEENPLLTSKYGIRSIPTIIIFVKGEKKDEIIGALPKTNLTACIDKLLKIK